MADTRFLAEIQLKLEAAAFAAESKRQFNEAVKDATRFEERTNAVLKRLAKHGIVFDFDFRNADAEVVRLHTHIKQALQEAENSGKKLNFDAVIRDWAQIAELVHKSETSTVRMEQSARRAAADIAAAAGRGGSRPIGEIPVVQTSGPGTATARPLADARLVQTELTNAQKQVIALREQIKALSGIEVDIDVRNPDLSAFDKMKAAAAELRAIVSSTDVPMDANNLMGAVAALNRMNTAIRGILGSAVKTDAAFEDIAHDAALAGKEITEANRLAQQQVIKTTVASQSAIRIIQDLPFGMMGITNNIQQFSEEFSRLKNEIDPVTKRARTMGETWKAVFAGMVGPMFIPLAITLLTTLALSMDKIRQGLQHLGEQLGITSRRLGDELKGLQEGTAEITRTLIESLSPDELRTMGEALNAQLREMDAQLNTQRGLWESAGPAVRVAQDAYIAFGASLVTLATGPLGLLGLHLADNSERLEQARASASQTDREYQALRTTFAEFDSEVARQNGIRIMLQNLREAGEGAEVARLQMLLLIPTVEAIRDANIEARAAEVAAMEEGQAKIDALYELAVQKAAIAGQRMGQSLINSLNDAIDSGVILSPLQATQFYMDIAATVTRGRQAAEAQAEQEREAAERRAAEAAARRNRSAARQGETLKEMTEKNELAIQDAQLRMMAQGRDRIQLEVDLDTARRIAALRRGGARYLEAIRFVEDAARMEYARAFNEHMRNESQQQEQRQRVIQEGIERELQIRESTILSGTEMGMRAQIDIERERTRIELQEIENRNEIIRNRLQSIHTIETDLAREGLSLDQDIVDERTALQVELDQSVDRSNLARIQGANKVRAAEAAYSNFITARIRSEIQAREDLAEQIREAIRDRAMIDMDGVESFDDRGRQIEQDRAEAELASRRELNQTTERLREQGHFHLIEGARKAHEERLLTISKEYTAQQAELARERRQLIGASVMGALSDLGSAAQSLYDTWHDQRDAELEREGVGEEERTQILMREGNKRFQTMKKLRIAEAIANTIAAGVQAYKTGVEIGGPAGLAVGALMMAAALATGYAQVRSLQALQPDGNGGSSNANVAAGSFTSLNGTITGDRVAQFEQGSNPLRGPDAGFRHLTVRFEEAIERFEHSASNMVAVTTPATAEANFQVAKRRSIDLNQ